MLWILWSLMFLEFFTNTKSAIHSLVILLYTHPQVSPTPIDAVHSFPPWHEHTCMQAHVCMIISSYIHLIRYMRVYVSVYVISHTQNLTRHPVRFIQPPAAVPETHSFVVSLFAELFLTPVLSLSLSPKEKSLRFFFLLLRYKIEL